MKAYQCGHIRAAGPALDDPSIIMPEFRCDRIYTDKESLAAHVVNWHKAKPEEAEYKEMEVVNLCHSCGRNSRHIKDDKEIGRFCEKCFTDNVLRFIAGKPPVFTRNN